MAQLLFGHMSTTLKAIGFVVVMIGFLWIVLDCAFGFKQFQHSYWWRRSGELPAGEMIERSRAIGAMRDISLRLNERHRDIVLPALVMVTGSIVILLGSSRARGASAAAEPGGPANGGQPLSPDSASTPPAAGPRR